LLLFVVIILIVQSMVEPAAKVQQISYSELIVQVQNDNIKSLTFTESEVKGVYKDDTEFSSYVPGILVFSSSFYDKYLAEKVEDGSIIIEGKPIPATPLWVQILPTLGMLVLLGVLWFVFMRQSQGGGTGKAMSFGKSRAKLHKDDDPDKKITFADVAGLDEEKEELSEIVDFLKTRLNLLNLEHVYLREFS